jgi:hypothetical protein
LDAAALAFEAHGGKDFFQSGKRQKTLRNSIDKLILSIYTFCLVQMDAGFSSTAVIAIYLSNYKILGD